MLITFFLDYKGIAFDRSSSIQYEKEDRINRMMGKMAPFVNNQSMLPMSCCV